MSPTSMEVDSWLDADVGGILAFQVNTLYRTFSKNDLTHYLNVLLFFVLTN